MFLHHFSLLPVNPLWELSSEVDTPAHAYNNYGFSQSESLGIYKYFILHFPGGFCHTVPSGKFYHKD